MIMETLSPWTKQLSQKPYLKYLESGKILGENLTKKKIVHD